MAIFMRWSGMPMCSIPGPAVVADGWATVDETTNGFIGGLTDAYATLGPDH